MKIQQLIILFMMTIIANSCGDNEDVVSNVNDRPEIIIGLYYGFCFGDCEDFYGYDDGMIYRDQSTLEEFFAGDLSFQEEELTDTGCEPQFDRLIDEIPAELLQDSTDRYGCPDCGDWGAIYLEYAGRSWTLDNKTSNNPDYMRRYVNIIQEVIAKLDDM